MFGEGDGNLARWGRELGKYIKSKTKAEIPVYYQTSYMIFQLCDGDLTKRESLGGVRYLDALRWFYLNAYRNYMMEKERKER